MEHEISSIQVLHHKKQVALHRGMEGGREGGSNRGNGATEGWREREERRKKGKDGPGRREGVKAGGK